LKTIWEHMKKIKKRRERERGEGEGDIIKFE
jgi:hypothetical protein